MAENFDLTNVNNMGSDFGSEITYSTKIPAFKIMEDPDYWKAYYSDNVGINTDNYSNLHELETDSNNIYYKFTQAVKKDPNKFKKYLGALYKATSNDKTKPIWNKYGKYDPESGTYTVDDNQKKEFANWYEENRTDQKFGYFHLTPGIISDETDPGDPKDPSDPGNPNDSNDPKNPGDPNNPTDFGNPYKIIPLLEQQKKIKNNIKPWLTPIIAGHTNDLLTAEREAQEKKKGISVAKETAPYKHAIVTNDYFTRSQMEKQAKELEWLASQPIAGTKEQEQYRKQYLDQAQNIRNSALQLKQDTFNKTSEEVNNAANWNRAVATEIANKNNAKIASARQLIANINAEKALKKGTIRSNLIKEMSNEIRQAEYISKVDKKLKEKQQDINNIDNQISSLIKDYETLSSMSIWDDEDSVNKLNNTIDSLEDQESYMQAKTYDQRKAFLENIKDSNPDVKAVFDQFEYKKQKLLNDLRQQISDLNRKRDIKSTETTYVSNTPEYIENLYSLISEHKSGGSVTKAQIQAEQNRFNTIQRSWDRFNERLYKQNRDANANLTKRLSIAQENLNKALGRLSQEDMLLLKKLFS